MSLKHRLQAVAILVILTASTVGFLIFVSFRQYQVALHKEQVSNQIAFEVYQRRLLADDYSLHPTQRAKTQWEIKQEAVERLVNDNFNTFASDQEKQLVQNIKYNSTATRGNFAELMKLAETGQNPSSDQVAALSFLLSFNAQSAITDASKLQEINQSQAATAFSRLTLLFSLSSVVFLSLLAVGFRYIWRSAHELLLLDNAKTDFFNNVSHEFRTPLTLILGPLEDSLTRADLPKEHLQQLELMHHNTLRLQKLVNNLLDFSRLAVGKMNASFQPIDLGTFTRDLASSFDSATKEAKLDLVIECQSSKHKAYVDPTHWETIVFNLLSNALKFTFKGHIKVTTSESKKYVELRIEDSGTGIPPNELKRLFERFHRVSGAKSRTAEGSGIGLALVAELVKLHGGTITVDSKVGEGTSFIVRIPFGKSHLPKNQIRSQAYDSEPPTNVSDAAQEQISSWFKKGSAEELSDEEQEKLKTIKSRWDETILVVDDNADMREYIAKILNTNTSLSVVTASNGQQALEAIAKKMPSLIITDVMMPEMDGFALVNNIRKNPAAKQVPIIFLSARAEEKERVSGIAEGVDDYLTKPFSKNELVAHVLNRLNLATLRNK